MFIVAGARPRPTPQELHVDGPGEGEWQLAVNSEELLKIKSRK